MSAYVGTLYGSEPPDPKAPQGEKAEIDPLSLARANAAAGPAAEPALEGGEIPPAGEETEAAGAEAIPATS